MPKKREYYIELAKGFGGVNRPCIQVEWTTFDTPEHAQEFYNILDKDEVPFYRQGVQQPGNKVAWYNC